MIPAAQSHLGGKQMAIGINMDDTKICWDSYFIHLYEMKQMEKERHERLLRAGEKARAAIKEFLNGQDT
jgi:hypothetical protein